MNLIPYSQSSFEEKNCSQPTTTFKVLLKPEFRRKKRNKHLSNYWTLTTFSLSLSSSQGKKNSVGAPPVRKSVSLVHHRHTSEESAAEFAEEILKQIGTGGGGGGGGAGMLSGGGRWRKAYKNIEKCGLVLYHVYLWWDILWSLKYSNVFEIQVAMATFFALICRVTQVHESGSYLLHGGASGFIVSTFFSAAWGINSSIHRE